MGLSIPRYSAHYGDDQKSVGKMMIYLPAFLPIVTLLRDAETSQTNNMLFTFQLSFDCCETFGVLVSQTFCDIFLPFSKWL